MQREKKNPPSSPSLKLDARTVKLYICLLSPGTAYIVACGLRVNPCTMATTSYLVMFSSWGRYRGHSFCGAVSEDPHDKNFDDAVAWAFFIRAAMMQDQASMYLYVYRRDIATRGDSVALFLVYKNEREDAAPDAYAHTFDALSGNHRTFCKDCSDAMGYTLEGYF
jgi:hypothetical protein